jgi:hypothetical protein
MTRPRVHSESLDPPTEQMTEAEIAQPEMRSLTQRAMPSKRLLLGDEIPAVLSPNELCALLPYGRSWFYERQAAGAFKHLETTLVPGERLYSGALVRKALNVGSQGEDGPRRRFFGKGRS